ncbi:MAG: serine/threonine-protein kinase [Planctomycetota bacterium]|nr:serine/threonine-protein kinase [Planctomycetota bacterium]
MRVTVQITAGPAKGQQFVFERPDTFLFGRAKDARVALPDDPYLSRHHFMIEIAPPHCRLSDLGSKNGTFVNDVRFGGRKAPGPGIKVAASGVRGTFLKDNDEVSVGDTRITVHIERTRSDDDRTPTLLQPDAAQPATLLEAPPASEQPATLLEQPATLLEPPPTAPQAQPAPPPPPLPRVDTSLPTIPAVPETAGFSKQAAETIEHDESSRRAPIAPKPGADGPLIIPGYQVEGVLGQGGMGVVYKGIQNATGRPVAIKMLRPQVEVSFDNFRAFHREIELSKQLRHPNIVELLDHGKLRGAYYCVLEYVDGMDLKTFATSKGGIVPLQDFAPLMLDILEGLGYAHRQQIQIRASGRTGVFHGIVHRDLKPENILLARQGEGWTAKVADFGLSKSYESAGLTDMTMAGVCGTPTYWPREQITHYRYLHPATDVFSVAAVFFEVLTGTWARPGMRETFDECRRTQRQPELPDFMMVIGNNPIPPILTRNPGLPLPLAQVIDRALRETEVPVDETLMRKTITQLRYPDAVFFREAIVQALRESGY